ncbi:MAG: DUF2284 domain-containing protein [Candidatus Methanomethylophilaceae archaeon]
MCENCENPDGKNCRRPEFQVPPMSGFGINIREYAEKTDIGFSFEKNSMIPCRIFLFNDGKTLS